MITFFISMGIGCFLGIWSLITYFISDTYTNHPELKSILTTNNPISLRHYNIKTTYYQFISQCPPHVVKQMSDSFKRSKSKEKANGLGAFDFEYRFNNCHDYYVRAKLRRCILTTKWNPVGDTTFEDVLVVDDFSISNETI